MTEWLNWTEDKFNLGKKQTNKHFIPLLVSNVYEFYHTDLQQRKIRRAGGNYDSPRNMSFTHVVQLPSHVQLFVTPWKTTPGLPHHLTKFAQVHDHCLTMPTSHLILWRPLLLLTSIFASIRGFSKGSAIRIGWPKYWSLVSASVLPVSIQGWFTLRLTGLISLLFKQLSRVFSSTTVRRH